VKYNVLQHKSVADMTMAIQQLEDTVLLMILTLNFGMPMRYSRSFLEARIRLRLFLEIKTHLRLSLEVMIHLKQFLPVQVFVTALLINRL